MFPILIRKKSVPLSLSTSPATNIRLRAAYPHTTNGRFRLCASRRNAIHLLSNTITRTNRRCLCCCHPSPCKDKPSYVYRFAEIHPCPCLGRNRCIKEGQQIAIECLIFGMTGIPLPTSIRTYDFFPTHCLPVARS